MKNSNDSLYQVLCKYSMMPDCSSGHFYFEPTSEDYVWQSHHNLAQRSFLLGTFLQEKNIKSGQVVAIYAHTPRFIIELFYAIIAIKAIPIILSPAKAMNKNTSQSIYDQFRTQLGNIVFIVERVSNNVSSFSFDERYIFLTVNDLHNIVKERSFVGLPQVGTDKNDILFIQLTSGSTGNRKAIAITNRNLIQNVSGITVAANLGNFEIGISWLPLYHDMGLVGAELLTFINGFSLVLFEPKDFIRSPIRWLNGMSQFHCSMAVSPNFGFDYCTKNISTIKTNHIDLSSLKTVFCGAEPIQIPTLVNFAKTFAHTGFNLNTFLPSYGMAETTLAVSIVQKKPARSLIIERESIEIGKKINIITKNNITTFQTNKIPDNGITAISVGEPIIGTRIKIKGQDNDFFIEDEICGEIVVQSLSLSFGIVSNFEGNISIKPFTKWFNTGDIGFFYKGELYVIDRVKNTIIVNGINYFANEIEQKISTILKVSVKDIIVFESTISTEDKSIILLINGKSGINKKELSNRLSQLSEISPHLDKIILGKKRVIPVTTSGKKKYFMCRKLIKSKDFDLQVDFQLSLWKSNF